MTEKLLTDVEYNYKFIDERIAEAAEKSGRKREDITFLAATKMVEPEVINHAISLGLDHIGENKVQELLSKYDKYNLDNCSLQFIGHLQTNKVRQIIDNSGKNIILEVDGHVSWDLCHKMRECGADLFVAGSSSVYSKGMKIDEAVNKMMELIK